MSQATFINIDTPIHSINSENLANKINDIEIWKARGRKATTERNAAKKEKKAKNMSRNSGPKKANV